MDWGPFFFCPRAVRMNLHDRAVESQRLHPDANDFLFLECGEHPIQNAGLRPPVHPGVYRMPAAESLRQAAPFAPVLGHVQNGVEHIQIGYRDVAPLLREAAFNASKLLFGDHHAS